MRVPVFVPDALVTEGAIAPPAVGKDAEYALEFVETAGEGGPDFTVHVEAYGIPDDDSYLLPDPGLEEAPRADRYPTVLYGPAWVAKWTAPRPQDGSEYVQGELRATFASLTPADARVRGRILRVAVVTETVDTSDPDPLRWRPSPRRRIREVEASPDVFETGLVLPAFGSTPVTPNPWRHETGVLVDLEAEELS